MHNFLHPRRPASSNGRRKFFTRAAFAALITAVSLPLVSPRARAANYYWDPTQTNSDPGSGGTGIWNTTSTFWKLQGTSGDVAWPGGTNTADFSGTAGIVTLGSAITAGGLIFDTGGYTLNTSTSTLTLNTSGITVNGGGITAISGTISTSGTSQFTVASGATLNLSGTYNAAGKTIFGGTGGTFNLSGTENIDTAASDYDGVQSGTLNNTAGTLTLTPAAANAFYIGSTGSSSIGSTLNVTGGTVQVTNATRIFIGDGFNGTAAAGDGTLSVGGGGGAATFSTGTSTNATAWTLGSSLATGTINLNTNGTLSTLRVFAVGAWRVGDSTAG